LRVGKHLSALDLSALGGLWLRAILRPDDIVMGFGPPKATPTCRWHSMTRRGVLLPDRQILYHTLWETVNAFLEHRAQGLDAGEAGFSIHISGDKRRTPPA